MDETPQDVVRWDDFYRTHTFATESSFARFVRDYFGGRALKIVELGCGDGRDAAFFHRQGYSIVAMDRASRGIASAQRKIVDDGGAALHFHVGDVGDPARLAEIFADPILRGDGPESVPLILYLRFFLHAIPEETEAVLLKTALGSMPAGFFLAAEFRTDADAHLPKAEGVHFRRFIAPADMVRRLEKLGFTILHEEARFGLSVYKGEDPHLCRIVARRDS